MDTVIGIDLTDISKTYAKKMEYLAQVWDGSKQRVSKGYWICEVIAAEVEGEHLSVYLARKLKLNILLKKIYEKAKRFFELAVFKQYALADGIYRILFNSKWGLGRRKVRGDPGQLLFNFARGW